MCIYANNDTRRYRIVPLENWVQQVAKRGEKVWIQEGWKIAYIQAQCRFEAAFFGIRCSLLLRFLLFRWFGLFIAAFVGINQATSFFMLAQLNFKWFTNRPFPYQQDQLETLPEILTKCLAQHQDRLETRRNFLHPDMAAGSSPGSLQTPAPTIGSPLILPHSR